ncbi:MAG: hypothetical protein QW767_06515, partial [Thermoprotei archaeon]
GAWSASSLIGVTYTPTSYLTGSFLQGYLTLAAASAVAFVLAYRELLVIDLEHMRSMIRSSSKDFTKTRKYAGMSPVKALLYRNLTTIELSGRVNMGAAASYRSARIEIWKAVAVSAFASAAYFFVARYSSLSVRPLVNTVAAVAWTSFALLLAQATLSNERCWLAFSSAEPAWYVRRLVASKLAAFVVLVSPFLVVDVLLGEMGLTVFLDSFLSLAVVVPSIFVLFVFLSGRVGPVQVREDAVMPGQFSLRQLALVLALYPAIGLVGAAANFWLVAYAASLVCVALALFVFFYSNIWRKLAMSLTERGFR